MLEVVIVLAQLGANFYFSDTALSQMLSKPSLADRFREVSALSTVNKSLSSTAGTGAHISHLFSPSLL